MGNRERHPIPCSTGAYQVLPTSSFTTLGLSSLWFSDNGFQENIKATRLSSCRSWEASPYLLCCGAFLSQPPMVVVIFRGPQRGTNEVNNLLLQPLHLFCWSIITESASCWWYQWSQLTPPLSWSIPMNVLIHCLDHRADVAFTSLVLLRPSFHFYSKPETSFQKSNTQSPNTNYRYISSRLKFIKKMFS